MSDWSYYDKSEIIRNVKDIKRTADDTQGEVRRLKKQVEDMTRHQEEILKAFKQMAAEMQAMREEMYPTVKNTKPGLSPRKTHS